jgi:hypothetical protein
MATYWYRSGRIIVRSLIMSGHLRLLLPQRFPGVTFYFFPADIVTQILDFGLPSPIDVQVEGNDVVASQQIAEKLMAQMRQVPGLVDLLTSIFNAGFLCPSASPVGPHFATERRCSLSRIISLKSAAGRISKGPAFTPGCFDINWMAWFRSLASRMRIPPICSFVSA